MAVENIQVYTDNQTFTNRKKLFVIYERLQ